MRFGFASQTVNQTAHAVVKLFDEDAQLILCEDSVTVPPATTLHFFYTRPSGRYILYRLVGELAKDEVSTISVGATGRFGDQSVQFDAGQSASPAPIIKSVGQCETQTKSVLGSSDSSRRLLAYICNAEVTTAERNLQSTSERR